MLIRRACEADIDRIAQLETICFDDSWSREMVAAELRGTNPSVCYLVVEGEEILGYAMIWFVPPEGEICNLAVHPDFRRRGLASLLMEAILCESAERGVDKLSLEVRESNAEAQALYSKFGFKIAGRRPEYYRDGEDAFVMRRYAEGGY
ncbi:MAG: ribosomal protein S18-alanine N-acetyltransferase [Clostridiales bacterium]|nr:ribosomal protein S18-alanine N-acetyltransferase [Clostridiales bacterium]